MKKIILFILVAFFANGVQAQDFITVWDLKIQNAANLIYLNVETTGTVNYTWETIPAGTSGSGSFTGTTAIISGLPTNSKIRLKINPTHFNRINFNNNFSKNNLVNIEQWGGVAWTSMETAFYGCDTLNISATDVPDLSLVTNMSSMFRLCYKLNSPANIDTWNTSNVTDMSFMFYKAAKFNQPIGNWNTSNVTNMSRMFGGTIFNQPIDTWNTSNVTDMSYMFSYAGFNQPIGNWNTGNVTNMSLMFEHGYQFNQPIGNWNTGNVTNMSGMFYYADLFNQPIGTWNTSNVTDMSSMFYETNAFNQPIDTWNTSNVTDMSYMFSIANAFNQPIGNWNTGNVINMSALFSQANAFNQPIGNWNTGNVKYMNSMFYKANAFNQPIGNWNTGNVISMLGMFYDANVFNQPIGNWNTSNVTNMASMFRNANSFNQPIANWNTGNVTNMESMFFETNVFNQPIENWDVGNVNNMKYMFSYALSFNQPLGNWNLSGFVNMVNMFNYCAIDCPNYSSTLHGWATNPTCPSSCVLGSTLSYGTNVINDRNYLINNKSWTIIGDNVSTTTCCFPETSSLTVSTCFAYTLNGQTYTSSGIYTDTLLNVTGCDSIITLNLTINTPISNIININTCNFYTFNNQMLTQNGIYYDTIMNSTGCSITTLNLTVNNTDVTTTQNGTQLSANATGAYYKWLKCNPFSLISGATNQTFTATANGDYAVAVTQNGCTDTSNCMTVNTVGLNNYSVNHLITISPNPTNSIFEIKGASNGAVVNLYNTFGQKLLSSKIENQTALINISNFANGIYVAEIKEGNQTSRIKISKQ